MVDDESFDLILNEAPYNIKKSDLSIDEEITTSEGKIHRLYSDGRREVIFQNGVRRELWDDGYSLVYFTNGDIKQTYPATHTRRASRIVYFYSEAKTTQSTFPNGL